jgi:hypothetical protein
VRFEIDCENFDLYFQGQVKRMTEQNREPLSADILVKMRKNKLGFLGKLYVLYRALRKRWYIVVEEEEGGMSVEEFVELRKAIKKRDYGTAKSEGLVSTGIFVTANRELADTLEYLNRLSIGPAYNYLMRTKNSPKSPTEQWKTQMAYITRFISFYEANKKRWCENIPITMPEFYVLLFCYGNGEVVGRYLYKDYYKKAYQSSWRKIKSAFGSLQDKGLLRKSGDTKGARMSITPLGVELVDSVLTKYAINC